EDELRADQGFDAMTDEDLVDRLLWHFRKSGGGGRQVRPFGELPPELQSQLAAAASLPGDELPIVVCYRNASSWVLLTTRRLIWAEDGRLTALDSRDIADATGDPRALLRLRG